MMEDQQEEAKQPVVEEETSPAVMSALRLEQKGHRWVGRKGGGGGGSPSLTRLRRPRVSLRCFVSRCEDIRWGETE